MPKLKSTQLQEVVRSYKERRIAIRKRLREFSKIRPKDYFYELAYCLLTPQSSAEHAEQVVLLLYNAKFHKNNLNPEPFLRRKKCYIRFHKTKSRHLLIMKDQFPIIVKIISEPASSFELREWLVKNVLGFGYKEASHFLRNIGKNESLAILDRHILRNLKRLGAINSIPKSIGRIKYLDIERRFSKFAIDIGISINELDLLFWSMETGKIMK